MEKIDRFTIQDSGFLSDEQFIIKQTLTNPSIQTSVNFYRNIFSWEIDTRKAKIYLFAWFFSFEIFKLS